MIKIEFREIKWKVVNWVPQAENTTSSMK